MPLGYVYISLLGKICFVLQKRLKAFYILARGNALGF